MSSSPHHHPHLRLSIPSRLPFPTPSPLSLPSPFPTPSKSKPHHHPHPHRRPLPSLLLLIFSLRSLYSLLPFLRSSPPSFSLFPFSFLVSLLSLLSSLLLLRPSPFPSIPPPLLLPPLALKSLLLSLVFLLRFQSLRSCGTAATILAEFSGSLFARSANPIPDRSGKIFGSLSLLASLFLLSDYSLFTILLPFLAGFLGFFERSSGRWGQLRQLGRKNVRILCLTFATAMLFPPALLNVFLGSRGGWELPPLGLGWPLANTVIFGVVLGENNGDEKAPTDGHDLQREFLLMFSCTIALELFYDPQLPVRGLLLSGLLIWIAVKLLANPPSGYVELGAGGESDSLYTMAMNPVRHVLSERKSRKIALFLLINTTYMVVEFVAGFMSNSLGLISDACHMLFNCAALAIGLYASYISRLPANSQFNYGRGRVEVLSGYVNAMLLVLVGALIVLESLERILEPQDISTNSLLTVSIGGLLVNLIGLVFFHEEHHHAHGGGGTCSHSHPHSHSHSHAHSEAPMHQHCLHDHTDHPHHHHPQENVSHEHNTVAKHHVEKPHNNARDHLSCCDHHRHDHQGDSHEVIHKEVGHSDHACCGYEVNLHHHSHNSSCCGGAFDKTKHEYENYERTLSSSHAHSYIGHGHGKIHEDGGCCGHNDSQHLSVTTSSGHCHSLHLKELPAEVKAGKKERKLRHIDHNMEGIFLHVLADTMGSVGVVISTLLIKYKGWLVADPACSIFISIMIVSSVLPLLRNCAEILMQRVSRVHEQELSVAMDEVMSVKGICGIQNVHIWNFTNTEGVGTLHLQISSGADAVSAKKQVSQIFHDAGVKDLTIQTEYVTCRQ